MQYIFILFQLLNFASAAPNKPYESYEEIVERLSQRRSQSIASHASTSIPKEKYYISLGLANTSSRISDRNIGSINSTGFSLGAAIPLIEKELFFEVAGKIFRNSDVGTYNADLQQVEAKLTHREPLQYFILNIGAGLSTRFMQVSGNSGSNASWFNQNYITPSLLLLVGAERRVSSRISLQGDLGYHRAVNSNPNGKNTLELAFHLNYHL